MASQTICSDKQLGRHLEKRLTPKSKEFRANTKLFNGAGLFLAPKLVSSCVCYKQAACRNEGIGVAYGLLSELLIISVVNLYTTS